MNDEILIKKMKLIRSFDWTDDFYCNEYAKKIFNSFKNDKLELIKEKSGFYDSYDKQFKKFNLKEWELWSTYRYCIWGSVEYNEENFIQIKVNCFDGKFYNGVPEKKRWTAYFKSNFEILEILEILEIFSDKIEDKWEEFLEMKFEEKELLRKQKMISKIENDLLG